MNKGRTKHIGSRFAHVAHASSIVEFMNTGNTEYAPEDIGQSPLVTVNGLYYSGITYRCTTPTADSKCAEAVIYYATHGTDGALTDGTNSFNMQIVGQPNEIDPVSGSGGSGS
jgi:hypothetical protein